MLLVGLQCSGSESVRYGLPVFYCAAHVLFRFACPVFLPEAGKGKTVSGNLRFCPVRNISPRSVVRHDFSGVLERLPFHSGVDRFV